jgi:uncharacterized repeat protein (TIGR01451 family)
MSFDASILTYDFVVYNESMTELVRVPGIQLVGNPPQINSAMFYASGSFTGNGFTDDFRVRPLYSPEPSYELGTEESAPPVEGANLVLVQSDSPDPVYSGSPLTYSFVVTNMGPWDATGVTLTDTLPAGANFSSASAGCTYNAASHNVICEIGNLAMNASALLTVTVTPTSPGTLDNLGTVSAIETDPAPSNNSTQAQTTVLQGCPCSIWSDATIPTVPAVTDGSSIEVGVKFRANTDGYITGLRFYKGRKHGNSSRTSLDEYWRAAYGDHLHGGERYWLAGGSDLAAGSHHREYYLCGFISHLHRAFCSRLWIFWHRFR